MGHEERTFERIGGETVFDGRIITVVNDTFRYADGKTAEREIVRTSGAAAVVAVDDEHVWLIRQPREPVGDPDSLEIPAGRLDRGGETPLECAQRELAEEIGKGADRWQPIVVYYTGAGFTDERVHLFEATALHEAHAESEENERIELVPWPLQRLDEALAECRDAKTLIGLCWLARKLAR
jgi:ADP-ribose pyrophosphatase